MGKKVEVQISQIEPKPEAISSVALGILNILADLAIVASHGDIPRYGYNIDSNIVVISVKWGWLFGLMGLILGILGMKSIDKRLAISGITLSSIAFTIYMLLASYVASFVLGFLEIFPFNLIPYP
jgi:hypothetical protein